MKENIFFIVVIIMGIYIIYNPDLGEDTYTSYQKYCSDLNTNLVNCKKINTMKTTHMALPDRQAIIGKTGSGLYKYENCSVFDAQNWECITPAEIRVMIDGKLSVTNDKETRNSISRFEYYLRMGKGYL